jgi:hypothetical protein
MEYIRRPNKIFALIMTTMALASQGRSLFPKDGTGQPRTKSFPQSRFYHDGDSNDEDEDTVPRFNQAHPTTTAKT